MPPSAIRRPITITIWLGLSLICLALSPLMLALAAIAGALSGRPQPLVVVRLLVSYFARELGVLLACGLLWVASGGGALIGSRRFQLLHFRLLGWFAGGFAGRALEVLDITVQPLPSPEARAALEADAPLLLFSRHAGPGDTILLVDLLLSRFDRLLSIVFKDLLTIDPCVDLLGHRLPHAVIDASDRGSAEGRIEAVSAELERRGLLLLFPEGGNFTPARRRLALRKLRRKGRLREAAKAERMAHVLPPRPTGALAALRGNPNVDVIFAAHTGLGLAAFPRELWREMPIGRTLQVRMWLAPSGERPTDPDEQVEWLYAWWKRLDDWIDEQGAESS